MFAGGKQTPGKSIQGARRTLKVMVDTMLTEQQQIELYQMTKAIYHHLGLDADQKKPVSFQERKKQRELDILKWREKNATRKE